MNIPICVMIRVDFANDTTMNNQDKIKTILATTTVPFFNQTLAQLGFEASIDIKTDALTIALSAGFPTGSIEDSLQSLIRKALAQVYPSLPIHLTLEPDIRAHITQLPGRGLRGVKNTIAVASGKGGVGKSTVAVNLAVALAKAGARVGILDADIYGPSIPLMLGDAKPVEIQDNHYLPVKAHGIEAMSIGYLTDNEEALIWRGPMLAKSLLQMMDITLWDDLDYLFIDLPPGTGDIQLSLVQKIPLTGAIVVTTPQNIATLDARKAIKMFEKTNIDVLGLVENMALHHCSACGQQEAIFGHGGAEALSERFNIPLLGTLPLDSLIRSQSDEGKPAVLHAPDQSGKPFMTTALRAALAISQKPLNYADKFPPIVVE
ncbi:iron-sulfur cluster carrier protein ApbC [Legionella spiritensis]|nr:iron-sulfur cluster carrier protein ApbC [Legionella spiritensis]